MSGGETRMLFEHEELGVCVGWSSLQGKRLSMEDRDEVTRMDISGIGGLLLGVYDGHGGNLGSDRVAKHLHKIFREEIIRADTLPCDGNKSVALPISLQPVWQKAYRRMDEIVLANYNNSGTTAANAFIWKDARGQRWLHVANIGDSRIVLCHGGEARRLTVDHKPSLVSERERIVDLGGYVTAYDTTSRVNGILAVSRAFGNPRLKKYVTCEPHCQDFALGSRDTHLIIACDGLWDVYSDHEAIVYVWEHSDLPIDEIAHGLAHSAIFQKGSEDNVTVQVVQL